MADLDPVAPRYELKDLTARAGVTARTVHFYIQQGLLPPAGAPGPGARYSEAFLARLVLIRRLQREHLPLAEIRRRLAALDDRAVMDLVALSADSARGNAQRENSALDYVRTVLRESHARPTAAPTVPAAADAAPEPPAPAAPTRTSWLRELTSPFRAPSAVRPESVGAKLARPATTSEPVGAELAPPFVAERPPVAGTRSQWDRIVLAPDVELHIRRPLTREQNKRVERLLVVAREILQEESR